jgi:hypothetical protein
MEFGSHKKFTGSMSDNFGPGSKGSGPGSFLSPDKNKQSAQASVEDEDEPEMDESTPDERPTKNPTMK